MTEFFNREAEKERRRQLRQSMPAAEVMLWKCLRDRRMLGCKFRRQYGVGTFLIDFDSVEIKLGIELDGESHFHDRAQEYDQKRQKFIESFGIKIIRILNDDIYEGLDGVLQAIGREIVERRRLFV
jgi:very-short-patch-repair endonuclease